MDQIHNIIAMKCVYSLANMITPDHDSHRYLKIPFGGGAKGSTTASVYASDLKRLEPGQYLNDSLILLGLLSVLESRPVRNADYVTACGMRR